MKFSAHSAVFRIFSLVLALSFSVLIHAQTFRGGISGTVTDSSGAVIANAKLTIVGVDTGFTRVSESTSSGDFAFQDLPLGRYSLTAEANGFALNKINDISVRPGQIYSLKVQMKIASATQEVEVNAAAVALETQSSTTNAVVNDTAVQNIPLNGRDFTQLVKIVPGYNGAGSLNGTRTNQMNWQIDGADNNDIWQNAAAANQGGVGSIAGVTIPIDSIDQFSVQTEGNAEVGRNGGGLVSLAIKSGTNQLHGSAYYYNRNEFFAAKSPFLLPSQRKPELRNQQYGASLGGPVVKDKLFYFVNYEKQQYLIQNSGTATEPTVQYVQDATALLTKHGIQVNPLSLNVLTLWPEGNQLPSAPATAGNYLDPVPQTGYSYNTIAKLDYNLTPRQTLSVRGFIGTGRQFAAVGTNVHQYYQEAPDITQNFMAVHNWAITEHLANQLLAGVGVFNQTFNDEVHDEDIPALGLNTGVTTPSLFGAPSISISGLDSIGDTQPLGRKDYTGHLTDTLTYLVGRHQFRFGGEFRRNYMDLQYQRNTRGTFNFTGSASASVPLPPGATAYNTDTSVGPDVRALADFLAGYVASSSFTKGVLRRSIYQTTFDLFAQDQFQVLTPLTLNYGVRYTYNAPFTSTGTLSDFQPGGAGADAYGLVLAGSSGLPPVYPPQRTNFAPRLGFAYQASPKMVVHGAWGIYFDVLNFNGFFDNRPGNGGAVGIQANPTGTTPVVNVSIANYEWMTGVDPFTNASGPTAQGLATISTNFRTAYIENFDLNTQYQLGSNSLFQVSYVGSLGHRLFDLRDINMALPGTPNSTLAELTRRPYYTDTAIPNAKSIGAINEVESEGASNYNSLQVLLRTSGFHGLTAQGSYTFGHALDVVSGTRGFAPQNSNDFAAEYGSSDFDVRHTFDGYLVYDAPEIGHKAPLLTKGWEGNLFLSAFTGTPFSVKLGSVDNSGTGELQDRANQIGNPSGGLSRKFFTPSTGSPYVQWLNGLGTAGSGTVVATSAAFVTPTPGTFGTSARNAFRGPAFFSADAALVKNTPIHERISLQLRAEMFNVFNHINLANPGTGTLSSSTFGRITATRNYGGAPGIGPGEPFNVQFAGKIIF